MIWRNFRKFSEIILVKLEKNYDEIIEILWKNVGNTSKKLKKKNKEKTFWWKLGNFYGNFRKNIRKIVRKLQIIVEKNCRENPKKFGNIWGALVNLFRSVSKFNPALMKVNSTLLTDISIVPERVSYSFLLQACKAHVANLNIFRPRQIFCPPIRIFKNLTFSPKIS